MNESEFKIAMHMRIMAVADLILYYHNPCEAKGGACLAGDPNPCCIRTRFKRWDDDRRCEFIGEKGCTLPNIECKVWLCHQAAEKSDPACREALHLLEMLSRIYGLSA